MDSCAGSAWTVSDQFFAFYKFVLHIHAWIGSQVLLVGWFLPLGFRGVGPDRVKEWRWPNFEVSNQGQTRHAEKVYLRAQGLNP